MVTGIVPTKSPRSIAALIAAEMAAAKASDCEGADMAQGYPYKASCGYQIVTKKVVTYVGQSITLGWVHALMSG